MKWGGEEGLDGMGVGGGRGSQLSYSFPPGGLQGGFEHRLSPAPGLRPSRVSCQHLCFLNQGWVPQGA